MAGHDVAGSVVLHHEHVDAATREVSFGKEVIVRTENMLHGRMGIVAVEGHQLVI